ncbi:hypothetical protein J6590_013707 [Homalodisca vitripennis]|nr:hypothetical protein J6590_013707 [Homalodisca vitripennis]
MFECDTDSVNDSWSARAVGKIDSARAATTGVVAARGPSRSSPVLPLRARSLLIRRHSELSATDWDTGILARFIAPPSHHSTPAAPRRTIWQRRLGHKLTSRSKADSSQNSPKVVNT